MCVNVYVSVKIRHDYPGNKQPKFWMEYRFEILECDDALHTVLKHI